MLLLLPVGWALRGRRQACNRHLVLQSTKSQLLGILFLDWVLHVEWQLLLLLLGLPQPAHTESSKSHPSLHSTDMGAVCIYTVIDSGYDHAHAYTHDIVVITIKLIS